MTFLILLLTYAAFGQATQEQLDTYYNLSQSLDSLSKVYSERTREIIYTAPYLEKGAVYNRIANQVNSDSSSILTNLPEDQIKSYEQVLAQIMRLKKEFKASSTEMIKTKLGFNLYIEMKKLAANNQRNSEPFSSHIISVDTK